MLSSGRDTLFDQWEYSGNFECSYGMHKEAGKILMARNCHKSVYHAVFLNELHPVYLYPEFDETMELNVAVSPEKIECLLEEEKNIQAVVLTSPTYRRSSFGY